MQRRHERERVQGSPPNTNIVLALYLTTSLLQGAFCAGQETKQRKEADKEGDVCWRLCCQLLLMSRQVAQMKASDLLQEFRSALHDSMGLMEREVGRAADMPAVLQGYLTKSFVQVALLDRMERLVHLSPDAQQVRDSCDEMFAIVAAKIDMAQRVQQHLNTFRSHD